MLLILYLIRKEAGSHKKMQLHTVIKRKSTIIAILTILVTLYLIRKQAASFKNTITSCNKEKERHY